MLKKISLAIVLVLLTLASITYIALEASDVAMVDTVSPTGEIRTTHIWFIDAEPGLILEAGHPQNPWVGDLRAGSTLYVTIDSKTRQYDYEFQPEHHAQIRSEMRDQYGWRDVWVGLLFDVSQSQRIIAKEVDAYSP